MRTLGRVTTRYPRGTATVSTDSVEETASWDDFYALGKHTAIPGDPEERACCWNVVGRGEGCC